MALQHPAGTQACQPIGAQVGVNGRNPADVHSHFCTNNRRRNANPCRHRRLQERSAGCRIANRPHADTVRRRIPSPPRNGRSHPLDTNRHSQELYKAAIAHSPRCACMCVAGHHHATSCRVDLHRMVTLRVLRGQRKGPLHLSIDPTMVVREDGQSRCGNTRRGRLEGSRHRCQPVSGL